MEIINVKVGSPSQSTNVDIENPSQVKAEIKNITINTGGSSKAVLYYPQELTSEQKQQARTNIDAASQKDLQDGVNKALKEAKESGDFDGKDGKDATVKIGPVSDLKELPELKIYQVTQEEYNDFYEAGSLDPDAVYVTPGSEYLTEETDPTVPSWAKAPTKPSYTASEVGADVSGTAESKVSAHNVSPTAHNDIRLLIQDITTQLTNFLDVDDTTVDQLSEVLTLINNNKGTLESLTTSKINVSAIVDNLTTSDASKVLSAKQGVVIKSLIDALQTALDSHTSNKDNPHEVTASQVGAYTKTEANTLYNRKADDYYLEINNNATGTGDCKFATIDYSECDSNNGVSALISMRSGHGNGKSFIFSQDVYIHVNYDGTVRVDNHKHYDSYVGKYDDVNHQYGDIFWVNDTDNKIVDFYCLVGQWTRVYMTPWKRIANSSKGVCTQHTTRIIYSEGTKVWANNKKITVNGDIPTWALKSTKPSYTADEVGALSKDTPVALQSDITDISTRLSVLENSAVAVYSGSGTPDSALGEDGDVYLEV